MIKLYCRTCNVILIISPDDDEYYIVQSGLNLRHIMDHMYHDLVETQYSETDEIEVPYIGIDNMPDADMIKKDCIINLSATDVSKIQSCKRISVDKHLMLIAQVVSLRSTCIRHRFGCVISKDGKIVSTGYNGAVKGVEHCIDSGCIRNQLGIESSTRIEICSAVHAEQNALIQAGKYSEGGTLYVNGAPCITCSKLIVNAGIERVVIPKNDSYPDKQGIELIKNVDIEVVELDIYDDLYDIMSKILCRVGYNDT